MRIKRVGLELGMKLATEEPGMICNLHDLHIGAVRRCAREGHSVGYQHLLIFPVELVTVPVALGNFERVISPIGKASRNQPAGPGAQTHGAAHLVELRHVPYR